MTIAKSMVGEAALGWFQELVFADLPGSRLGPGEPAPDRVSFSDVVLVGRLREAIRRLKRAIPPRAPSSLRGTLRPKLLRGESSVS